MGDSDARRPAEDDDSTFRLEVSSLDSGQPSAPKHWRHWLRVAQGGAALVVLAGLLYAFVLPHGAPVGTSPALPQATKLVVPTPISYKGQALRCPAGAAWSPDGTRVAVLYYLDCGGTSIGAPNVPRGGALAIYADPTQAPGSVLALDPLVIEHANVKGNALEMSELVIGYSTIDWSPDGQSIAITYDGSDFTTSPDGNGFNGQEDPQVNGIILAQPTNLAATARVINQPVPLGSFIATPVAPDSPLLYPAIAWNLTTRQQEYVGVPQALAYQWGVGDTLQVAQALSASAAPRTSAPTPVGNPDGGAAFSLWRAGQFMVASSACGNSPGVPPAGSSTAILLQLTTSQPVWSPDGSMFIPGGLGAQGQVHAPLPSGLLDDGCTSYDPPPEGWLQLPMRDAALRAILATSGQGQTTFYWRPDGQRVVDEQIVSDNVAASVTLVLTVYDCATGKALATIKTPFVSSAARLPQMPSAFVPFIFTPEPLIWSPEGQQLLVLGSGDHGFTILDASQLGG